MKKVEKTIELGGRKLTLSTGGIAEQADAAVMASYGETVVLATVVAAPLREDLGYFPLTVDYQERLYAGGRIKGSRWVKREGRPSDEEILTARLIDRSIRPLFPKNYKKQVQVIITVLSVDLENTPDIVSAIAVSAALSTSSIPWKGPIGVVKVGMKENSYFTNPTDSDLSYSEMELVVSSTKDSIVMIEAGAKEVSEENMVEAIGYGQKECLKVIDFINSFAKEVGVKKDAFPEKEDNTSLKRRIKKMAGKKIEEMIKTLSTREAGHSDYDEIKNAVVDNFPDEEKKQASEVFDEVVQETIRKMILSGKRPDGRKPDELRDLSAKVGVLPRTHGSAIFKRGQTQVLSVTTLGAPSLEQLIETAEGEETKRYIHHYSMPPYSVGETGRIGYPSRREIGHGALAERALLPVIPSEDEFPYTIRVVSEVLSSNGSTSMASTCGSTLSLMDAGVPIKAPVAGIAMGLIIENEKKFVVLTDITGLEDGNGDMDFKVAGTRDGITALQLDVKTLNLSLPILKKAMAQAREARGKILEVMIKTISKPRAKVSTHAPKVKVIKVDQSKIGEIIGSGGKTIRKIIAETGAQVEVEDDGSVNITGLTEEEVDAAVARIEGLTREVTPGEIYEGEVKRIQPFGAFVEILPGKEGLVHISDMSKGFVRDPHEVVSVGDNVRVRVKEVDDFGRINLSMILDAGKEKTGDWAPRRDRGGGRRFDGRDKRGLRLPKGEKRSSGPHFPASRFLERKKKNFSR